MIRKIWSIYKTKGSLFLLKKMSNRLFFNKGKSFKLCKQLILNKSGLEIGGPSNLFSKDGYLPVYPLIKSLDNINFSSCTIWEGQIREGKTFKYDPNHSCGMQYILEASELKKISKSQYDFILSSHILEHCANPIKALIEWMRVLKDEGTLILVLPNKEGTFDHKRKVTPLEHIINDFEINTTEDDLTHLDEIFEFHDLEKDPGGLLFNQFRERSIKNYNNRCLHHHVFDAYSAAKLVDYIKLQIQSIEVINSFHIIIIAKKLDNYCNKGLLEKIDNKKIYTSSTIDRLYESA